MGGGTAVIALLLLTGCLQAVNSVKYEHVIYINPATGQDHSDCLTSNDPSSPCANLTWVFQQDHSDSTHYILSEGSHYLTEPTPDFQSLDSLAFTGTDSVIICTDSDSGLAFIDVEDVTFHDIAFSSCSALRNSTSKNFADDTISEFYVGLYFYLCKNINMSRISVSHSPNGTGVVVYDTKGTNTISESNFTDNRASGAYPGGGGFYVEFTNCNPGVVKCDTPTHDRNEGASFTFKSCHFSRNQAGNIDANNMSTYIIPHGSDHEAFGRGGGLSLFVKGITSSISFEVVECLFINNTAQWGGGLFVEFHDETHSNNVTVVGSWFIHNRCLYSTSEGTEGGGMRVGHYVYGINKLPLEAEANSITLEQSFFSLNSALQGGGLSVSFALQQEAQGGKLATIQLGNNTFEYNTAKLGAAVYFQRFGSILKGEMGSAFVEDCSFRHNTNDYASLIGKEDEPYQTGIGAVHVDEMHVAFCGNLTFGSNNGSALSVIGAMVNFTGCWVEFLNNTGNRGAAIALLGASYMQVSNGTRMTFTGNKATTTGGAIHNTYINRRNLKSDSNCFIRHTDPFRQPDDWEALFEFTNNTDMDGKHPNAIHSTSIYPCAAPGGSGITANISRIFCWKNWSYKPHSHMLDCDAKQQVTSEIGSIKLNSTNTISVYPGWEFRLPIKLQDDLENEIEFASFTVTYSDSEYVNVFRLDSVVVFGNPNISVNLSVDSLGDRIWHFDFIVDFMFCPAGFIEANVNITEEDIAKNKRCDCAGTFGGVTLCDETSKTIQLLNGMWIGELDNKSNQHYVMDCPVNFCSRDTRYINNTLNGESWDTLICGKTDRTGINCGVCIDGYGVAVNSLIFECVNCTDINLAANIAKYISALYFPLAALFIILIVFDIRLTTGPANAFILYCQMVTSTFDLNADGGVPILKPTDKVFGYAYRFPFGILNLEFIENYIPPICFTPDNSFTALTTFVLDYAVALFPLLMIILTTVCQKVSENCCMKNRFVGVQHRRRMLSISRLASVLSTKNKKKSISDALLPAFASFVLLSYNKFSTTSSYILNTQNPIGESGDQHSPPRVYYASHLTRTSPEYLVYFVPAMVVLVTVVLTTPLILLDYPVKVVEWCIMKVKFLRMVYPNDKVHLFLNMFQGCYRSRMRFFAGLYFVFRLVINLSFVLTDTWPQQFVVQQASTTLMITLLALCQPYEWWILNYVDILIFTNMALLNSVSFYLYSITKINPKVSPPVSAIIVQYMLVFLPLVYMISYIIWNVTRSRHTAIKLAFRKFFKRDGYEPLPNNDSSEQLGNVDVLRRPPRRSFVGKDFEDDFEAMLSRAEDQNTYAPSLTESRSMTVVEVSGRHSHGLATTYQSSHTDSAHSSQNSSTGAIN